MQDPARLTSSLTILAAALNEVRQARKRLEELGTEELVERVREIECLIDAHFMDLWDQAWSARDSGRSADAGLQFISARLYLGDI